MADISSWREYLPSVSSIKNIGISTFNIITYVLIFLILFLIIGIILYFIIRRMKYKNNIIIWEKVGGNWEITGRDKAMEKKYGMAGDTVFFTLKRKKVLPRPVIQTGRRIYWYAIREDGEWINIGMEDIDMNMKKARIHYLHPEVRYSRTALQKGLRSEFEEKKGIIEKYGHIIIPFAALIIILFFLWFLSDKLLSLAEKLGTMIDTSGKVMEKADAVLSKLNQVCSGSGIIQKLILVLR